MGFTNNTNNAFPPAVLQPLYRIWRDWCMGDSLGYLNDNFLYLDTTIRSLSSLIARPGAPLQVMQAVNNNASTVLESTSYPTPWIDIPLLQINMSRIDPTSKMRIQTMINASQNYTNHPPLFRIMRTANGIDTAIGLPPAAGNRQRAIATGDETYNYYSTYTVPIDYIDDLTGVNASIITYKMQWMLAYAGYAVLNRGAYYSSSLDVDAYYVARTISTMTVTELKG
jgi:hypothetical protein